MTSVDSPSERALTFSSGTSSLLDQMLPSANLLSLPNETLTAVCKAVELSAEDLKAIALISKKMRGVAQSVLFEKVDLVFIAQDRDAPGDRAGEVVLASYSRSCLKALAEHRLASKVKTLTIALAPKDEVDPAAPCVDFPVQETLVALFKCCPGLIVLTLLDAHRPVFAKALRTLPSSLSSLRALTLTRSTLSSKRFKALVADVAVKITHLTLVMPSKTLAAVDLSLFPSLYELELRAEHEQLSPSRVGRLVKALEIPTRRPSLQRLNIHLPNTFWRRGSAKESLASPFLKALLRHANFDIVISIHTRHWSAVQCSQGLFEEMWWSDRFICCVVHLP
ncbi:hypothetical protein JCM6882_002537 [Rhodosporidiobolus microsporus]